jgi:hypothetical protein
VSIIEEFLGQNVVDGVLCRSNGPDLKNMLLQGRENKGYVCVCVCVCVCV